MPLRNIVALTAALVFGAACMLEGPDDQGAPEQPSQSQATPGEQVDGTTTVEEFERDISGAASLAEQYWQAVFDNSGQRFQPIRRVIAYERDGELSCGRELVPANNAVYCPAGDFIAYDVDWAVEAFRQIGDAFLFYLLGHEYAHGVQVRLGIDYRYTIQQELQADCMAGAYMGDSVKAGSLTMDEGDLEELSNGLLAVADDPDQPWFAPGAHGNAEQRTEAFNNGFERSLAACDLG
jgi:predicted metalloprotease